MLLSENEKTISEYFSAFPKSTSNLQYFERKIWALEIICFWNYRLQKAGLLKCLKSPVSEHLLTVNMLKGPKGSLNLHGRIFVIFFYHSEKKAARKSLF